MRVVVNGKILVFCIVYLLITEWILGYQKRGPDESLLECYAISCCCTLYIEEMKY